MTCLLLLHLKKKNYSVSMGQHGSHPNGPQVTLVAVPTFNHQVLELYGS